MLPCCCQKLQIRRMQFMRSARYQMIVSHLNVARKVPVMCFVAVCGVGVYCSCCGIKIRYDLKTALMSLLEQPYPRDFCGGYQLSR